MSDTLERAMCGSDDRELALVRGMGTPEEPRYGCVYCLGRLVDRLLGECRRVERLLLQIEGAINGSGQIVLNHGAIAGMLANTLGNVIDRVGSGSLTNDT